MIGGAGRANFLRIRDGRGIDGAVMKHAFASILVAGMLSSTACAVPYYQPTSQLGALTPYDMQPVYTIEGLWGIAAHRDEPDVWGPRLRFSLYSDAVSTVRHQFSLNVAGLWGSRNQHFGAESYSTDVFLLPLTAGYELNIALGEKALLYFGGKAGYAWGRAEGRYRSYSSGGFTCSGGLGVKYMPNERTYLNLGYEYASTDFSMHRHTSGGNGNFASHIISLGVGWQF